ncbi:hypothetical protein AWB71_05323 [Caballeronia peredens]|nr:hypothetical protein AWB71_05323 [Caballeronia peredens]
MEILYVHNFETNDEYLSYVQHMLRTEPHLFDKYMTVLQRSSENLLASKSVDMHLHILTNYMLGVCHAVEYTNATFH